MLTLCGCFTTCNAGNPVPTSCPGGQRGLDHRVGAAAASPAARRRHGRFPALMPHGAPAESSQPRPLRRAPPPLRSALACHAGQTRAESPSPSFFRQRRRMLRSGAARGRRIRLQPIDRPRARKAFLSPGSPPGVFVQPVPTEGGPTTWPSKSPSTMYSRVFGDAPADALELVRQGCSKQEILERTGQSIGVFDATFTIEAGEIFVVMGLSGSGKSTLVRMLNRLIEPTAGRILVEGTDINVLPDRALRALRRKDISMVFQSFALMPHMTVLDNTAFGLELAGVARAGAAGRRRAGAGGARRLGPELSGRTLRRHAAARGAGPRAGVRSVHPADGRGLLGARPHHPYRDAERTAAAAADPPLAPSSSSRTISTRPCASATASPS